jgi:predicted aspartyl protease
MARDIRKIKVISCWRYEEDKPPIPSIVIKVYGVGIVLESIFRIDTGYPGQLLVSTSLYKKLNLHLAELPEEEFGVYSTASGIVEMKRSEGVIEIPQIGFKSDVIIETPRYFSFKRNLIGRELINRFKILLYGGNRESCIVEDSH